MRAKTGARGFRKDTSGQTSGKTTGVGYFGVGFTSQYILINSSDWACERRWSKSSPDISFLRQAQGLVKVFVACFGTLFSDRHKTRC